MAIRDRRATVVPYSAMSNERNGESNEGHVALLRRRAQRTDDPLIPGRGMLLQSPAKSICIARNFFDKGFVRRRIEQQQLGIFYSIDEVLRWRTVREAGRISQPPGLRSELDDVLLAVRIDDVLPQAALDDKCGVLRYSAGALQKLVRAQARRNEHRLDEFEVVLGERRSRFEVRLQYLDESRQSK